MPTFQIRPVPITACSFAERRPIIGNPTTCLLPCPLEQAVYLIMGVRECLTLLSLLALIIRPYRLLIVD
jgi:hypothetical protein